MSATATAKKAPAKRTSRAKSKPKSPATSVSTKTFVTALRRVMRFACTDNTLPSINAVKFEYSGGNLILVATDRFKMAAEVVSADYLSDGPGADFTALVPVADVRVVLERLKTEMVAATIQSRPDGRVEIASVTVGFPSDAPPFPDWRRIADGALKAPVATESNSFVNPEHMRPFIGLGPQLQVRVPATAGQPIVAIVPGQFFGMVMPIRVPTDVVAAAIKTFGITSSKEKK